MRAALLSCRGGYHARERRPGRSPDRRAVPRSLARPGGLCRGVCAPEGARGRTRRGHDRRPAAAARAPGRPDAGTQRRPATSAPRGGAGQPRHRGRPRRARRRGHVSRPGPARRVSDPPTRRTRPPAAAVRSGARGGDDRHLRRARRQRRPARRPSGLLGRPGRAAPRKSAPSGCGSRAASLPRHRPERHDRPGRLRPHRPVRHARRRGRHRSPTSSAAPTSRQHLVRRGAPADCSPRPSRSASTPAAPDRDCR